MTQHSETDHFRAALGETLYHRWGKRLNEVNQDIARRGIRLFETRGDLVTGYAYNEFYDWDAYFENIYLSYYGIGRYGRAHVEAFLRHQLNCGFVARSLIRPRLRQHHKPFLAQLAVLASRQDGNWRWLEGHFYERLRRYLDYWFWYSDHDRNGLPVWDSADHSGMDNQIARAGAIHSESVEGVDLACYLVRELEAMQLIAEQLGLKDDSDRFAAHGQELRQTMQSTFWNEADGFYYDRNERTGETVDVKTICGLIPLWINLPDSAKADRLIQSHLRNADEFWLDYPLATWARDEPGYYQHPQGDECNWCGPCWIPTNYMIFQGLRRYGLTEVARDLAYRTCRMALEEPATREYYNAETGAGIGMFPFWGWSVLAYVMPLEVEFNYDPTAQDATPLKAILRDEFQLELR
jgi:glycogen debranching enzyme